MSTIAHRRESLGLGAKLKKGFAYKADDPHMSRFLGALKTQSKYPNSYFPVIESTTLNVPGPLTDSDAQSVFGAIFDPLGARNLPKAVTADSTMADPGKVQQYTVVFGIGWELMPEPLSFTTQVNAIQAPTTSILKPVSPETWSIDDMNTFSNAGYNSLALQSTNQIYQANLEWNTWAAMGLYWMTRAYDIVWQFGHNTTLINQPLSTVAYVSSRAQSGSASNSEVSTLEYIRRTNEYYRSVNSTLIALQPDRTRIGYTGATAGVNIGIFRPTRQHDTVPVTYGGAGLENIMGNAAIYRLRNAFILQPGVPIGLRAQVRDTDDYQRMLQFFELSQGLNNGAYPALITEDSNIVPGNAACGTATGTAVGTAGQSGVELSLDSSPYSLTKTVPSGKILFKGGAYKIRVNLYGFEVDRDTAEAVTDNSMQDLIRSETGVDFTATF